MTVEVVTGELGCMPRHGGSTLLRLLVMDGSDEDVGTSRCYRVCTAAIRGGVDYAAWSVEKVMVVVEELVMVSGRTMRSSVGGCAQTCCYRLRGRDFIV